nr:MAG TPA: hypothetical protein [Caudoviricetes sp.]
MSFINIVASRQDIGKKAPILPKLIIKVFHG